MTREGRRRAKREQMRSASGFRSLPAPRARRCRQLPCWSHERAVRRGDDGTHRPTRCAEAVHVPGTRAGRVSGALGLSGSNRSRTLPEMAVGAHGRIHVPAGLSNGSGVRKNDGWRCIDCAGSPIAGGRRVARAGGLYGLAFLKNQHRRYADLTAAQRS